MKKQTFAMLAGLAILIYTAALIAIAGSVAPRLALVFYPLGKIFWIFIIFFSVYLWVSFILTTLFAYTNLPLFLYLPFKTIFYLVPSAMLLGKILGVKRESFEKSYIDISNRINKKRIAKQKPKKVLLLLPHCLQAADCPWKITFDIENCKGCGKCSIAKFVEISHRYNIPTFVATGGTIARRIVKKTRPEMIVAVACERDLFSGIIDVHPMPIIGVLNRRPFGPCYNTEVDVEEIVSILDTVIPHPDNDRGRESIHG